MLSILALLRGRLSELVMILGFVQWGGGYGYMGGPNIWLPEGVWQPIDSAVTKELKK
jgi:hypothetical protein